MAGNNYSHQLDAKNRMRIPAKLREELGEGYSVAVGSGGCLYVYTKEQMQEVRTMLSKVNPYREEQLKPARLILSSIWDAEEDKQGRILLPEYLRKYAKIVKDVVVIKGPNCIEIWAKEIWESYFEEVNFASLADAFDALKQNV